MTHYAFVLQVLIGGALVVGAAAVMRNRFFATFTTVLLTVQGITAVALWPRYAWAAPAFIYLQACVHLHFLSLSRARMRPLAWRLLISIPGLFFGAIMLFGLPWGIVALFGRTPYGVEFVFVAAAVGVVQSLYTRERTVDVVLDGEDVGAQRRLALPKAAPTEHEPLRIVQITDPHLGPLMSVRRLRRICERAVARDPHLVLLTGDFLTMESHADPMVLEDSLRPLAAISDRVFACFGNHDHEAPELVRHVCRTLGITLLVDQETRVDTPAGPVQLVGADYAFRKRREHLAALAQKFPRREDHLRVWLLHDPGAFRHIPEGEADLVFSGHTHGGQVGLVSLGIPWTFVSAFTPIPDFGFWGRGPDRLYVHRGTGVYGFPLRVGVPGEQSLVRVFDQRAPLRPETA